MPEHEQTFASKYVSYRDAQVGDPKDPKNHLGEIFRNKTPAQLAGASFTAIHIFSAGCFDESTAFDLGHLWDHGDLLDKLNVWEPPNNWLPDWRLERRFNSEGLLLYHQKIDYTEQYIQFTEHGIIEAVDHSVHSWALHRSRTMPGLHWENGILKILPPLIAALKITGGQTPAMICLSLRDYMEYMTVTYRDDPDWGLSWTSADASKLHSFGIRDACTTFVIDLQCKHYSVGIGMVWTSNGACPFCRLISVTLMSPTPIGTSRAEHF